MKKDKSKLKCFNYGNKGHFANECSEPNKINVHTTHMCVTNMLSNVLLIESCPFWIVDSGTTDRITNSRDKFMDFRQVPRRSKWIHVGNNEKMEVLRIDTCKLVLRGGKVLLLHDVLYAPEIRRNLVFVFLLIKNGFCLSFHDTGVDLFLKTNYYGSGCWDNSFIIFDLVSNNNNAGFSL